MAIQKINLGTAPNGEGGDTLRSTATKINENFSNETHAASRLVGTEIGNLMQVGDFGIGPYAPPLEDLSSDTPNGFTSGAGASAVNYPPSIDLYTVMISIARGDERHILQFGRGSLGLATFNITSKALMYEAKVYTNKNATKDSNGFLKGASPIVKVHADKVVLNDEAEQQNVTFKKNGIGDYTITTESGLSTDGWYIELPKDMNGNPKVAVTLSEVEGVITLKSYKRIFSMETFNFIPDLDTPLDIPTDRWIDIRLNEIPVEQPIMPSDPVAPYSEV